MVHTNISGGARAPQQSRGLLNLLLELDEARVTSLLASSEGSAQQLPSPFTGLLLRMNYDPLKVLDLVNRIWGSRVHGRPGPGRRSVDRLPLVCYLLPVCEANYGTVPNVLGHYYRLNEDDEFRILCGYVDRVPSRSVFRDTAVALSNNWSSFRECVLSSDASEKLVKLFLRDYEDDGKSLTLSHENIFASRLSELGWNGNLPPHYRLDVGSPRVPRREGSSRDEVLEICFRRRSC